MISDRIFSASQSGAAMKTAADILQDFRITTKSSAPGRYATTCPKCSHNRKKSKQPCLGVTIDGTGVGFYCNHCGWKGGAFYDERQAQKESVGLNVGTKGNLRHGPEAEFEQKVQDARDASDDRSAAALRIWRETVEWKNTLADRYLSRSFSDLDWVNDVRFHPSCPFGKERLPCMVALYRDIITNEPRAIHRTALTPDGRKIDRKALGPKSGCAIKLSDNADVANRLTVAEGIETSIAAAAKLFRPVWALGDANAIASFPVLAGIESLTVIVDNDISGTGQRVALACSKRWTAAGREVFRIIPTEAGADMADIVRRVA